MPDIQNAFERYSESLLRSVADSLLKPRTKLEVADLIEKCTATIGNAAVIDRRIRDLPDGPRFVLSALARSHQPIWKVGHLVTLAASFGHPDGFKTIRDLLSAGLLFPYRSVLPVADFDAWFAASGGLHAVCMVPAPVMIRARSVPYELTAITAEASSGTAHATDSLDWPLRLSAVRQRVEADAVRMTRTGTLYKKDQTRFETDTVISVPGLPDSGILGLFWALACRLLNRDGETLVVSPFPKNWDKPVGELIPELLAGFFGVESWDPLNGATAESESLSPVPTSALLVLLRLATIAPDKVVEPQNIANWLWEYHPSFPSIVAADHVKSHGVAWIESLCRGVFEPLGIVERIGERLRLSPLGRYVIADGPAPVVPPLFPNMLLVQPNAEILAYRQGLTPSLIALLSRFAEWKVIGPACTLELTETQVYRGLESGLTVAEILHPLQKHGSRPVPAAVIDLLKRWGSKRERVSVFASTTLVEFSTPADLDSALERGIVSIKLTDRIGLTADGRDPDYAALRLVGNRDYESRLQPCVKVGEDGVTWTIDAALADLLLDSELIRMADPINDDPPVPRRVKVNPEKIRTAVNKGMTRDELDQWFILRTGAATPAAVILFAFGPNATQPTVAQEMIARFETTEFVDGLMQWPSTKSLISERIGPKAIVVLNENLTEFTNELKQIEIQIEMTVKK